jgi:hypothetical protein
VPTASRNQGGNYARSPHAVCVGFDHSTACSWRDVPGKRTPVGRGLSKINNDGSGCTDGNVDRPMF